MQKYIYPEIILEFLSQILASYSINTHASLPARRPAVNVRCRSQQMRSHREFPFLCVQVPVSGQQDAHRLLCIPLASTIK